IWLALDLKYLPSQSWRQEPRPIARHRRTNPAVPYGAVVSICLFLTLVHDHASCYFPRFPSEGSHIMNEECSGNNLVEVLQHRALYQGDNTAFTFLAGGEWESGSLTFRELDGRAQVIAANLQQNAKPGERALLVYPSGLDYIAAFFGCLYAGIIPVPVYPPRANGNLGRLLSIWNDCQASLLLSNDDFSLHSKDPRVPRDWQTAFHLIKTDKLALNGNPAGGWQKPEITSKTIAFLQYTS